MAVMLVLLGGMFAVNVVVTFGFIQQHEAHGTMINVAGRQRMLSQKMSKEAFAIAAGNGQLRTTLQETAGEFDGTLTDLLEGNAVRGLSAAQGEVKTQLEQVSALWGPFHQQVQVIQTASVESPEFEAALAYVGEKSVPLLNETNTAVGLYADQFSGRISTGRRVVIGLAVAGALVAAAALWFVLTGVTRPLSKLAKSAIRLGQGERHHRVDINTADEMGAVARAFNAMARRLDEAQETLEQRVEERTKAAEAAKAELEVANAALRESEEVAQALLNAPSEAALLIDTEGTILALNDTAAGRLGELSIQRTGKRPDEYVGLCVFDLFPLELAERRRALDDEVARTGKSLRFEDRREGKSMDSAIYPVSDAQRNVVRLAIFSQDVTERKRAEESLREQARRDALTGVLNHAAIVNELQSLLSNSGEGASLAVAMADVDGMKATNDTYGHQIGDAVLLATADALSRDGAIAGRYGGDEFVAILPGADRAAAERYRDAVLQKLADARLTDPETGGSIPVAVSIGLAIYPDEADSVVDLVKLSDSAMYAAKRPRHAEAGRSATSGQLGANRAAEMVSQILPLLTSPAKVEGKLKLVVQRISVGAGYDTVNIDIFSRRSRAPSGAVPSARTASGEIGAWHGERVRMDGDRFVKLLLSTRRGTIVDDPQNDERLTEAQRGVLRTAHLRSAAAVPLLWEDELVGILSAASKREGAFTPGDVQFLTTVAAQVTALVRMETLVDELQSTSDRLARAQGDTMLLLADAAEAHDRSTGPHLQNVFALTEALACELGYSVDDARELGLAAVLHDIGKIRVPESVLATTGQLTDEERETMKRHTVWGAQYLGSRPGFELAATIARRHHERWDGTGYPDGLAGDAIPEPATIVAVADALDAMTHDRLYGASRSRDDAVSEIAACSGTQFSPKVVEALERLHQRNALPLPHTDAPDRDAA